MPNRVQNDLSETPVLLSRPVNRSEAPMECTYGGRRYLAFYCLFEPKGHVVSFMEPTFCILVPLE